MLFAKKFANRRISWVPAGKVRDLRPYPSLWYECDMRLLNRARVAFDPDNTCGNIDYTAKFSSLDKLKSPLDCQHPDIRHTSLHRVGIHTESAENDIINDAIRFANQTTSLTVDGLNGGQGIQLDVPRQVIQPVIHTENQTRRDSHEEMITDDPPDAILFSNQANTFAVDVLNGAQEIQSSIHTEYQTLRGGAQKSGAEDMNLDHELLFTKPTFSLRLTQEERPHWKDTVTEGVSMSENDVDHSQSSPDTNLDHELPFPKPTVSLGLTQEERPHPKEAVTEGETMCENAVGKEICEQEDQLGVCRKSKRLKALPKSLVGQYECDMRILNRARVAFDPDNTCGNIDYAAKFSSLDKLKSPFTIRIGQSTLESNDLYELVQRSSPLQPKVRSSALQYVQERVPSGFPAIYLSEFEVIPTLSVTIFPSISKKHWVGVCVDCTSWSIVVMDCNIALRTDSMMVKEVTPIAQMFPYLLKQGGKQLLHKDARAFSIERPRSIPQNTFHADSAVSALLLVQAHAVAGLDVCKCITPDKISSEVEKLAVRFYEATVGML
ncbi:hypothetical protein F2Q70_00040433 [Brassica cretica]|uniref:Ubiquitin-like protease family profile domain-containing protein n=1 Tax=Brassica cretica TaxID=69181 RepID=A0A8S9K5D2_BRACR|nr:hypothetical protein F2Q70_00040433 [Brassica cretica]